MSTKDHNETLSGIHLAIGAFLALVLLIAPWMVARDLVRHKDQIPVAVIIFVIVLALTLFMVFTAIAMHKKKPLGRELALWAAPLLFMICWPVAIYSWWFMHSDGAKQMYGVKPE